MITDDDAEGAVHWLIDNAHRMAAARANRVYAEEFRKSIKAVCMAEFKDEALGSQERNAYMHERYLDHLSELKRCVHEDEEMRATRAGKEMVIEAWRTQKATQRAHKI